jgi:hypothetical protein
MFGISKKVGGAERKCYEYIKTAPPYEHLITIQIY